MTQQVKETRSFQRRIADLRWIAPLVLFALAALHQLVLQWLTPWLPDTYHFWIAVALYGLSGSIVVWLALDWLAKNAAHQEQTKAELRAAYDSLTETHRQLLAVHDIGREIASAEDMQQVLELAARAPVQLAGATGSAVVTFGDGQSGSDGRLKLDMAWGLSDDYLGGLRQRIEDGIPAGRCRGCDHLTARVSGDCPLFAGMQGLAQEEGIGSLICLPITVDQRREGIISAYFASPDGPPDEQVQLLNIVATEIAAAADGVRFRANQIETLYTVENLGQADQDLDGLLEQILDATLAGWGASNGAILLYDEGEARWQRRVQRGLDTTQFDLLLHLAEEIGPSQKPVLIPSLPAYLGGSDLALDGLHSAAAAPLVAGGQLWGALVLVAQRPGLFEPRQASFFEAVAQQAALVIHNAQLHTQVEQMAVVGERYRLSREMHDGLAQTLGALGWQLDRVQKLLAEGRLETVDEELQIGRRMVREAYTDIREAIDGLRLDVDHTGGLASALDEYIIDFEQRTGIKTLLDFGESLPPLSTEAELQLLRIVQEALINVRKHAGAEQAMVQLQARPSGLELTVADDGQGFDPALPRGRGHLGLATMRERAQSFGGEFSIVTGPGQGTRLTVTLPLERAADAR